MSPVRPGRLPARADTLFPAGREHAAVTDWRAIIVGFLVGVASGLVAFALPVIGHVGAGLVAGFVAGALAGAAGGLIAG